MTDPQQNTTEPPFFSESVAAGFPSPAEGEQNGSLNLHELCVRNPAATYFIRARGDSMLDAGISDGDILVVDRSLSVRNGDIVIAAIGGSFTVKYFERTEQGPRLLPANPAYAPIIPAEEDEFFGVVSWIIKSTR